MALGAEFDINEAIVLMFGDYPTLRPDAVTQRYGANASDVVRRVNLLMREVMGVPINWEHHDNVTAGDVVETLMAQRHPELTAAALECLGNYFAFQMR